MVGGNGIGGYFLGSLMGNLFGPSLGGSLPPPPESGPEPR